MQILEVFVFNFFNRDVLGALNILRKHLLQHRVPHELFGS